MIHTNQATHIRANHFCRVIFYPLPFQPEQHEGRHAATQGKGRDLLSNNPLEAGDSELKASSTPDRSLELQPTCMGDLA